MSKSFKLNLILALFVIIYIITFSITTCYMDKPDKTKQDKISALTTKVEELYSKVSKIDLKGLQGFDKLYEEVYQMQNDIKIQNKFLGIQFDGFQKYYLEHERR